LERISVSKLQETQKIGRKYEIQNDSMNNLIESTECFSLKSLKAWLKIKICKDEEIM